MLAYRAKADAVRIYFRCAARPTWSAAASSSISIKLKQATLRRYARSHLFDLNPKHARQLRALDRALSRVGGAAQ
ncbi:hypothetical protein VPNG_00964 [Cytospora leucostoma]|uniref:Uncharacterized protein n=1 Tax=Cytospora leucostoma TaxID=1230097 RepID=A0A423XLZ6_9PEZI|nr:hypothetical protein VPNG_00964 [Cytospora leucostoma]